MPTTSLTTNARTQRSHHASSPDDTLAGAAAAAERPGIETREAWDRVAPGYDRNVTETHLQLAEDALRRAGFRPGMRFLDVAAGSGALALPAARMGAEVVAIDHSPVMIRLLDQRVQDEGLPVRSQVMDGQALGFADGSFDMAGSQFGVMLFPDMPAGIREMARVVRPGGRVLVIAYADPRRMEFLGFFTRAVQSVRPEFAGPPMDPPPLPLQLADPGRLRRELEAAGLTDVTVEEATERTEYRTGDELWDWLLGSNPIVEEMLARLVLTEAERTSVRQALDGIVRDRAEAGGPAALTSPVNIGIGTR